MEEQKKTKIKDKKQKIMEKKNEIKHMQCTMCIKKGVVTNSGFDYLLCLAAIRLLHGNLS